MNKNNEKQNSCDTPNCNECGGRTALITGFFTYEPHDEPYNNDRIESAKVESGDCWAGAFKCDECGNVQGLWTE